MKDNLQAIVTLLALVNPAVCASIFSSLVSESSKTYKAMCAVKTAFVVCIVLGLAALFGANILALFGVSLDAFAIAGGGILSFIGIKMLMQTGGSGGNADRLEHDKDVSLSPLILFAASPGTITGVITISSSHSDVGVPVSSLVAIAVVTVVLLCVLLAVSYLPRRASKSGLGRQMITSYLGVIVIAMGVQFAFTGIKQFMYG